MNDSPLAVYLGALRRSAWQVAVLVVTSGVVAYLVASAQDDVYRAKAKIVVSQGGVLGVSSGGSPEAFTQTMSSLLDSDIVAREVVRTLSSSVDPTDLRRELEVESRPESAVLDVSFDAGSPQAAERILGAICRVYARLVTERLPLVGRESDAAIGAAVFDPPTADEEPIAPSPLRTAAIAVLLALIAGVVLAFVRDAVRRPAAV